MLRKFRQPGLAQDDLKIAAINQIFLTRHTTVPFVKWFEFLNLTKIHLMVQHEGNYEENRYKMKFIKHIEEQFSKLTKRILKTLKRILKRLMISKIGW